MAEKEELKEGAEAVTETSESCGPGEPDTNFGSLSEMVVMPSVEPAANESPAKGEGSEKPEPSEKQLATGVAVHVPKDVTYSPVPAEKPEPEPEPAGPILLESPFRPENHRCFRVKIDDHPEVAVNAVDESEAIRTVKERFNIDGIKQAVVSIVKEVAIKSLKELLARFVL